MPAKSARRSSFPLTSTAPDASRTRSTVGAPDAAAARASLYRRTRNGFELVCFLRVVNGVAVEVSE